MSFHYKRIALFVIVLGLCMAWISRAEAGIAWDTLFDSTGNSAPRSMRGIALSDDETTFYTGWIQGSSSRAIRTHNASTGALTSTFTTGGAAPGALATDDRGFVYAGTSVDAPDFRIYNSTVTTLQASVSRTSDVLGIDVVKSGANYYAYISTGNAVQKWDVTTTTAPTLVTSFGASGSLTVGSGLRGLHVLASGEIIVTARDSNTVYRIDTNGDITSTTAVTRPMDVTEYNGSLYVTSYNGTSSLVAVLDPATLTLKGTLTTGISRNITEGYAGINVDSSGRLYVVDQLYEGSNSSTSDRVLISSPVPEPAAIGLLGGAVALLGVRRRRAA